MTGHQLEAEINRVRGIHDTAMSFEVHWSHTYLRNVYDLGNVLESLERRLGEGKYADEKTITVSHVKYALLLFSS